MPALRTAEEAALPAASGSALPDDVLRSPLFNHDLAPTSPEKRTWGRWHLAALWVGMSVCSTTYMLGANLLKMGMNWRQAVVTILLGNLIVLVPMCLNAHAGTKYGIPFPVLIRASFGTAGSNVPALARGIVACGWFGIQTWLGGKAIYQLALLYFGGWKDLAPLGFLDINAAQLGCFLVFWAMNVYFIVRGTESIKWLETLAAPFLLVIGFALLGWSVDAVGSLGKVLEQSATFTQPSVGVFKDEKAGGFGHLRIRPLDRATRYRVDGGSWRELSPGAADVVALTPAEVEAAPKRRFEFADDARPELHVSTAIAPAPAPSGSFWVLFFPALTAMVCYWATLSLNIPDFTRFARSQRDQVTGQLLGLPTTMAFYSFIGIAVTCASLIAFEDVLVHENAPWDPVDLLGRFGRSRLVVIASMVMLLVAILTTNIAANVVSPANDISNLAPNRIGYVGGGLITAFIGIAMMPWKLLATNEAYVYTWLIGYGALLGPIAGIMIADYFVVRRQRLDVADLYRAGGRYGRWNGRTLAIFAVAIAPCMPAFLEKVGFVSGVPAALAALYDYTWFIGFGIAFALYAVLGKRDVTEGTNA